MTTLTDRTFTFLPPVGSGSPGDFLILTPFGVFSELLPTLKGFNTNLSDWWRCKFDCEFNQASAGLGGDLAAQLTSYPSKVCEAFNSSVIVYRGAVPTPGCQVIVADAEGAKAVFADKMTFGKPTGDYA